jgi:hypothetical protein
VDFYSSFGAGAELIRHSISDDAGVQKVAPALWEISNRQSDFCFAKSMKSVQLYSQYQSEL